MMFIIVVHYYGYFYTVLNAGSNTKLYGRSADIKNNIIYATSYYCLLCAGDETIIKKQRFSLVVVSRNRHTLPKREAMWKYSFEVCIKTSSAYTR